jgi:hypothetical protein
MSNKLSIISIRDLKKAIKIKAKLESLQARLNGLLGTAEVAPAGSRPKRRMSAAGRRRIIAAQKARWAKFKAAGKSRS